MFYFKNISSDSMGVVIEEEEHFLAKASQRIEQIDIEGKDGAIFNELGYSPIDRPIKVQILDTSKLDEILAWLNGEGILEYKDRITKARFYTELEPIRTAGIKIIETTFSRDPFWTKKTDNYLTVTTTISNEGNKEARPIIKLTKGTSSSVELTIGGIRFKYNFNGESYVEIDCEEMTETYGGLSRSRQIEIGYDYPLLPIGSSNITVHSGDATIEVKRKDRWL